MSSAAVQAIEQCLERTRRCTAESAADPERSGRLSALRVWQAQRLAATYADLGRDPDYADAVEFFLSDLYGPEDLGARDLAFERAWPLLRRGLPAIMLEVLAAVTELQALTAELDLAVAMQLPALPLTAARYVAAYRTADDARARTRQIDLIVAIGAQLARAVKLPFLGWALRAARAPAHVAGFSPLHSFLERGYRAFHALTDPEAFLTTISDRERRLMRALLTGTVESALALLPTETAPAAGSRV